MNSSLSDLCLCLSGVVWTTRKTGSSPFRLLTRLFLRIEYPDYLPDMACMHTILFLNALEGNISYVANGWCEYLKWLETETRVFIGDSDDGNEWEVLITFRKLDFLSYRRWQKQWLARMILYGASPPKSTTTFTKTHSWSFISAFLYRHDHHSTSITNLTNRTSYFSSTFVLLQVS